MSTNKLEEVWAKSVAALEEVAFLAKAHVSGYTRKDGTFVNEHEDGRSAKPKKTHSYTYFLDHGGKAKAVQGMIDAHDHEHAKQLVKEQLSDDEKSRFLGVEVHGEVNFPKRK